MIAKNKTIQTLFGSGLGLLTTIIVLLTACAGRRPQPTAAYQANEPTGVAGALTELPSEGNWIVGRLRGIDRLALLNVDSGELFNFTTGYISQAEQEEREAARNLPHIIVGLDLILTDGRSFVVRREPLRPIVTPNGEYRVELPHDRQQLLLIDSDGREESLFQPEPDEGQIEDVALPPDGSILYVATGRRLLALDVPDGSQRVIVTLTPEDGRFMRLAASADGRLAYVRSVTAECWPLYVDFKYTGHACRTDLFVIQADGSQERRLTVGLPFNGHSGTMGWWQPGE